jgi:hypothetical protein
MRLLINSSLWHMRLNQHRASIGEIRARLKTTTTADRSPTNSWRNGWGCKHEVSYRINFPNDIRVAVQFVAFVYFRRYPLHTLKLPKSSDYLHPQLSAFADDLWLDAAAWLVKCWPGHLIFVQNTDWIKTHSRALLYKFAQFGIQGSLISGLKDFASKSDRDLSKGVGCIFANVIINQRRDQVRFVHQVFLFRTYGFFYSDACQRQNAQKLAMVKMDAWRQIVMGVSLSIRNQ